MDLTAHGRRATELRAMVLFQLEQLKIRILGGYSVAGISKQLAEVVVACEDLEAHANGAP
jgi:hypothetical protein